jgi:biotin synthase
MSHPAFHDALARFLKDPEDQDLALRILQSSTVPSNALRLFCVACDLRDAAIGKELWWSAGISAVLPCAITPRCTYCTFFNKEKPALDDIVIAAKMIAELGIHQMHLSGGTKPHGYDDIVFDMVRAVKKACDVSLTVNFGPSFTRSGVRQLKKEGVTTITSSIEVLNADLFAKFKPGDSLNQRIELIQFAEDEGLFIKGMMLVGLGETLRDRIDHLYFLRKFSKIKELHLSRYNPYPGISSGGERCSPWEIARMTAVARILMPHIDIGISAGNSPEDIPLRYAAGGGNHIFGALASLKGLRETHIAGMIDLPINERITVVNRMPLVSSYLHGLGVTAQLRRGESERV